MKNDIGSEIAGKGQDLWLLMFGKWVCIPLEHIGDTYETMYKQVTDWMAGTDGIGALLNIGGYQLRREFCAAWHITDRRPPDTVDEEFRQLQMESMRAQIRLAKKAFKDLSKGEDWQGDPDE